MNVLRCRFETLSSFITAIIALCKDTMNWLKNFFLRTFQIKPEDEVPEAVAVNFKHNVLVNTVELSFYFFADSFWSINTILPVFAASLTDEPFLIGLIPAIVNAGWFCRSYFLSNVPVTCPKFCRFPKEWVYLNAYHLLY